MLYTLPSPHEHAPPRRGLVARFTLYVLIALSAAGAILSAVLNIATYFSDTIRGVPLTMHVWWFPHITALALCFLAVIIHTRRTKNSGASRPFTLDWAPRWLSVLVAAAFVYALVNFFAAFMIMMPGGSPRREDDGRLVLSNHGRFVREITEAEFRRYEAYELRGFSGHWILFHLVPAMLYWRALRPDARRA